MHRNAFSTGAQPQSSLGELTTLPRSLAGLRGLFLRKETREHTFNGMAQVMEQKREVGGEGNCCSSEIH